MSEKQDKKKLAKQWKIIGIVLIALLAIFIIGSLIIDRLYHDRIYPGVRVGEIDLTGKTLDEAEYFIQTEATKLEEGIIFYYQDKELVVKPAVTSFDIDLSYQIFSVNPHQTALSAYAIGRDFNFLVNWKDKFWSLLFNKQINLSVEINQEKLTELLQNSFNEYVVPVANASLQQDKYGKFIVQSEQAGVDFDYEQAVTDFGKRLIKIDLQPIALLSQIVEPKIYKQDALNIDSQAKQVLNLAPLTWHHQDKEWIVEKADLEIWLDLQLTDERKAKVVVGLNSEKLTTYLEETVAPELDQPAVEAKFKMSGNKVSLFQGGQDGWEMDVPASVKAIIKAINNQQREVNLIVEETKAASDLAEPQELGIVEIVGTGTSNFYGSPANRRHNIKTGADTLNGLLIKPGEEFSLMSALGEIDGAAGYLPELVIRDHETVPEYGGGLCQIGTTIFRTALASGLPITMRRNHSYRVSYYEPAGTDATIYDPWPDLKFINDLDSYILIQTRIDGNDLYFDFWGTKDGRVVDKTDPVIYNITEPEPTKLVETTSLAPGEKKCTEHAHNGADAYFDYAVTYPDGELVEERFYSHYVPWQEVCLIGVEEINTETEVDTGVGVYEKMREQTSEEIE